MENKKKNPNTFGDLFQEEMNLLFRKIYDKEEMIKMRRKKGRTWKIAQRSGAERKQAQTNFRVTESVMRTKNGGSKKLDYDLHSVHGGPDDIDNWANNYSI